MIDQLYEELKTISDADLLTLVNEQRLALDLEFKTENKLTREKLLNSIPVGG